MIREKPATAFNRDRITDVIYHSPCNDGFGAAYVVWNYYKANELPLPKFIGISHEDALPSMEGARVLMLDICLSRDRMLVLRGETDELLVLDHHDTAKREIEGLSFAVIDDSRSGVMMAWDYFYPRTEIPNFLYYIGMRDLWRHEAYPKADAFTTAFPGIKRFEEWHSYYLSPGKVDQCVRQGADIIEYKRMVVKQMATCARDGEWEVPGCGTYHVRFVNQGHPWVSDLGNYLVSGEHSDAIAMVWSKIPGGLYTVSLRSAAKGPDVGRLAKAMGGGGHPHAAGFRLLAVMPEALIRFKE